jgi:quercetin dioxygenase-like cupin family protein
MQFNYPVTIDNGGTEKITFIRLVKDGDSDYVEIEGLVQPAGGPPMHVHHKQDETITVVKGKIATQVSGEEPEYHSEGETITFKAGVPHKFWNAGTQPLITTGNAKPANNVVYFLSGIFQSIKENGGSKPATFDVAYLLNRYSSEFDMLEIPLFIKKVIFPASLFFGKLSGKHKKFKDAPKPL